MKIRNVLVGVALGVLLSGAVWADCNCHCGCCAAKNCDTPRTARVGAGVPGEKIDFSKHAAIVKDIAVYDAQVTVNADNVVVDASGQPASPLSEFTLSGAKAQINFTVIGRDNKGNYKVLANDLHTCVGWVNNVDYSSYAKIGSDNRSVCFVSAHPESMRLIVSYQTVPGSSTPIQKVFNVSCLGASR